MQAQYHATMTQQVRGASFAPAALAEVVNANEAMHLDSPARGPHFAVALAMARQRTEQEYRRAVRAIANAGGAGAVRRLHGKPVQDLGAIGRVGGRRHLRYGGEHRRSER